MMDHSHRARLWSVLPLYLLLVVAGAEQSAAQNETGVRFLSPSGFRNAGYDSTQHWYMKRFPIIRSLPPLNSGMPPDLLSGYIHLDSFARFNADGDMVQPVKMASAWLARPELLRKTVAACYAATDFDPVTFKQYLSETALKRQKYMTPLGLVTEALPDLAAKTAGALHEREFLRSMMMPDYILHVRIVAVDSVPSHFPPSSALGPWVFSVTAEVLDTLKGRVVPFVDAPATGSMPLPQPRVRFQYFAGYSRAYDQFQELQAESAFLAPGERGARTFSFRPGQEFIVPLTISNWRLDTLYDYYNLTMDLTALRTLPVIGGQVRDVNLFWSGSSVMDYADWRAHFTALRGKIMNGTY